MVLLLIGKNWAQLVEYLSPDEKYLILMNPMVWVTQTDTCADLINLSIAYFADYFL